MKKKIVVLLIIAMTFLSVLTMTACGKRDLSNSMFVEIESSDIWTVVYHRETKVMYAVSDHSYNRGSFTMLVNADGTQMIYKGKG